MNSLDSSSPAEMWKIFIFVDVYVEESLFWKAFDLAAILAWLVTGSGKCKRYHTSSQRPALKVITG